MATVQDLPEFLAKRIGAPTETGCWPWTGVLVRGGYGMVWYPSLGHTLAHRATYQLLVGPIPDGLTIDHLCHDETCVPPCLHRRCVNPAHMGLATQWENTLRGSSPHALHAKQTHCIHGHEFTEANTYRYPSRPGRACRACRKESARGRKNPPRPRGRKRPGTPPPPTK